MKHFLHMTLCLVLLFSLFSYTAYAEEAPEVAQEFPEGYLCVAQDNSGLELYADPTTGNFMLLDRDSGLLWYSAPPENEMEEGMKGAVRNQLLSFVSGTVLNPINGKETSFNSVMISERGGLNFSQTPNGYVLRVETDGIAFSLQVTLENGAIQITLPISSLEEQETAWLQTVQLVPSLLAGSVEQDGFLLIPDGSGAIIRFNNGKSGEYNEPIYGPDRAFPRKALAVEKQTAVMPVYGIENSGVGMTVVVSQGAAAASIRASSAGNGSPYNIAGAVFTLREKDNQFITADVSQKIYEENRSVHGNIALLLYPSRKADEGYMGMATAFRQYLTEQLNMEPLAQTPTPGVLTVYGGVACRQRILGVPTWEKPSPLTTFSQAAQMLTFFNQPGMFTMELQLWDNRQILGKAAGAASPARALGGMKGLEELSAVCREQQTPLLGGVALATFSNGGGVTVKKDAIRTLTQEPAVQFPFWCASSAAKENSPSYLRNPEQLPVVMEQFLQTEAAGIFDGVSVTDIGAVNYSNYCRDNISSADDMAGYAAEALAEAGQQSVTAVHGGMMYAVADTDLILDLPTGGSMFQCVDAEIPFYQIALSGLTGYTGTPVNLQANSNDALLWALETGSCLSWAFAAQMPENIENTPLRGAVGIDWVAGMDTAAAQAEEYLPLLSQIVGQKIIYHSQVRDGVTETLFENQIRVYVNHTDMTVSVDGMSIPARGFSMDTVQGQEG